jgi:DNA mismatch repair protein MutS
VSKQSIEKSSETPLMKQYNQIKARHPGAMLLFRVGDFYETFVYQNNTYFKFTEWY